MSARATTRADFAEGVKRAIDHELIEQNGFLLAFREIEM
jgi:hypothetical protein